MKLNGQHGRMTSSTSSSPRDIEAAKAWAAQRPNDAPAPTAHHLDSIRASELEEAARASAERKRLEVMAAAQSEQPFEQCSDFPIAPLIRPTDNVRNRALPTSGPDASGGRF